jgi:hypothetical protein
VRIKGEPSGIKISSFSRVSVKAYTGLILPALLLETSKFFSAESLMALKRRLRGVKYQFLSETCDTFEDLKR